MPDPLLAVLLAGALAALLLLALAARSSRSVRAAGPSERAGPPLAAALRASAGGGPTRDDPPRQRARRGVVLARAQRLARRGKDGRALRACEQHLLHDPEDVDLLLLAAELHRREGDLGRAAARWAQAAGLLARAGRHADAGRAHRQVLAWRPDDLAALEGALAAERRLGNAGEALPLARALAAAADRRGDARRARAALAATSELAPDDAEAALRLAAAHAAAGDRRAAAAALRRAADALLRAGRSDDAAAVLTRIPLVIPGDFPLVRSVATELAARGHPERALAAVEHRLAHAPEDADALELAASLLAAAGRAREAADRLEAAARAHDAAGRAAQATAARRAAARVHGPPVAVSVPASFHPIAGLLAPRPSTPGNAPPSALA